MSEHLENFCTCFRYITHNYFKNYVTCYEAVIQEKNIRYIAKDMFYNSCNKFDSPESNQNWINPEAPYLNRIFYIVKNSSNTKNVNDLYWNIIIQVYWKSKVNLEQCLNILKFNNFSIDDSYLNLTNTEIENLKKPKIMLNLNINLTKIKIYDNIDERNFYLSQIYANESLIDIVQFGTEMRITMSTVKAILGTLTCFNNKTLETLYNILLQYYLLANKLKITLIHDLINIVISYYM
jgi:hypothetical protein